jgi:hypothetical protein
MAAQDPGLFYIDAPARFLLTGAPPDEALFVQDRLHLSALGYQLWRQVIQEQLRGLIEPVAPPAAQALPAGTRLLLDLGPTDGREGEPSPSPDHLGQHWNNWPEMASGQGALAGEHLDHLVTSQGEPTQVSVTLTGGFLCNGWSQGGLRWPQAQELGDLAVGSATGDFFYTTPQDSTGGLWLRGLDPQRRYTLRLFASREHDQRRVTQYSAHHAGGVQSVTLQTSGPGASAASTGNRAQVASLTDLAPDERGGLFVDVQLLEGDYGYLSVLELRVQ